MSLGVRSPTFINEQRKKNADTNSTSNVVPLHPPAAPTMADHALAAAEFGPVLLLNGKVPAMGKDWPAKATRDPERIRELWDGRDNNVGIKTGDRFMVVDTDCKPDKPNGFETLKGRALMGDDLPRTRTVRTPSGGEHRYYRIHKPVASKMAKDGGLPGVDLLADGNHQVVAPGSRTEAGTYEVIDDHPIVDAPEWILEICGQHVEKPPRDRSKDRVFPSAIPRAIQYLKEDAPVAVKGESGDLQTVKVAMRLSDFGLSETNALDFMLEHYNRRCPPGWSPERMKEKVRHGYEYAKNPQGCDAPELQFDPVEDKTDPELKAKMEAAAAAKAQAEATEKANIKKLTFTPSTPDEWKSARLTPTCIVKDMYYVDVGTRIAPGGTGKTTELLYELVHIRIGLPLYGHKIMKPGKVALVTAEDSRELCIARLRQICVELFLTQEQIEAVMSGVLICDVAGLGIRLTVVKDDVVLPNVKAIDQIREALRGIDLVMLIVDPAVSFGVGESRVNDAEQALVEAARVLKDELGCCFMYVQHTGKQNAREKASDQYAGRNGSAMPDGCRMVQVMHSLTPTEWRKAAGDELGLHEAGLILYRPKLSYARPQPEILIRRSGFSFKDVPRVEQDEEARRASEDDQVWNKLKAELDAGNFPTGRSIEKAGLPISRDNIREAIERLDEEGRVEYRKMPNAQQGGARKYLHALGARTPSAIIPDSASGVRQ